MERSYWLRQSADTPLFPDILWSRPENRNLAARIALIGGHAHDMQSIARLHDFASKSGAGQLRIILPDALARLVPGSIPEVTYVSSTHAGGLNKSSLTSLLAAAAWGHATVLANDLGHGSETAIAVESLLANTDARIVVVGNAALLLTQDTDLLLRRPETLLVATFEQLQRLARSNGEMLLSTLPLMQFVEHLHRMSQKWQSLIVVYHLQHYVVAFKGRVSTTREPAGSHWQERIAANIATLWPHNTTKLFEAATAALLL